MSSWEQEKIEVRKMLLNAAILVSLTKAYEESATPLLIAVDLQALS